MGSSNTKLLKLVDTWNSFQMKFSIFYPSKNEDDEIVIHGVKSGNEGLKMTRTNTPIPWMPNKYGENIRVFEHVQVMSNKDVKRDVKDKEAKVVQYKYVLNRFGKKKSLFERENNIRTFQIGKTGEYALAVEDPESMPPNKVFVVNGVA